MYQWCKLDKIYCNLNLKKPGRIVLQLRKNAEDFNEKNGQEHGGHSFKKIAQAREEAGIASPFLEKTIEDLIESVKHVCRTLKYDISEEVAPSVRRYRVMQEGVKLSQGVQSKATILQIYTTDAEDL